MQFTISIGRSLIKCMIYLFLLDLQSDMTSTNDKVSSESVAAHHRPNIDGGWGWFVLVGAFIVYFIADGWSYSIGIIFSEIVDYFGESKGKTALIPTLIYGIPMIISPIICAGINVFGCRKIGVIGGCFTAVSFFIAFFATSVNFLCLSIGIFSSVGLAMVYISSLIVVTQYFDRRRGLATGLAVTGSGLGAFAFPPLMDLLMAEYSWRGLILITSGIGFNLVPACMLYRALETDSKRTDTLEGSIAGERPENVLNLDKQACCVESAFVVLQTETSDKSVHTICNRPTPAIVTNKEKPFSSLQNDRKQVNISTHCDSENVQNLQIGQPHDMQVIHTLNPEIGIKPSHRSTLLTNNCKDVHSSTLWNSENKQIELCNMQFLDTRDLETASIKSKDRKDMNTSTGCNRENTQKNALIAQPCVSDQPDPDTACIKSSTSTSKTTPTIWSELRLIPSSIFDRKLFHDKTYLVFCSANFLLFLWISMPFVYLVDRALELDGDSDRAFFLLSIIAIARTAGQLIIGLYHVIWPQWTILFHHHHQLKSNFYCLQGFDVSCELYFSI